MLQITSPTLTSPVPQPWSSASSSIQYPSFNGSMSSSSMSRTMTPSMPPSSFTASMPHAGIVSPPPQASINPSPLSRRRSDYIDQSQEALAGSGFGTRASIDYPDLSAHNVLRPPPAVAPPQLERQDNRPRIIQHQPPSLPSTSLSYPGSGPKAPTIQSEYPVHYWPDVSIATSGLKNMGNTCYMNATIQCLNATIPFARFFVGECCYDLGNCVFIDFLE
jgi:ubiquitin carboxyl-terminal hydrolase 8